MDWKEVIAELRDRGWTQQQIAQHVGSSQASVSDLSNGKTLNPTYALGKGIEELHKSGELPPGVLREQSAPTHTDGD
jgi:transcriptional regulator with XRE-family HTH domain